MEQAYRKVSILGPCEMSEILRGGQSCLKNLTSTKNLKFKKKNENLNWNRPVNIIQKCFTHY